MFTIAFKNNYFYGITPLAPPAPPRSGYSPVMPGQSGEYGNRSSGYFEIPGMGLLNGSGSFSVQAD